ncbi:MAG TPA: 16S rRNA (guanine(966)-N(2))-methyltransferase RsmD [Candidatus Acidoferrales bacterium]|nr:16S rRNA (guanine(966)-N(2))-methyltransferase RsmD [Candidatus Acidoferrales bacterium]
MRVIAGKFGSRRLRTLRGLALRPTSDRLRETLFDILGGEVRDSLFIDAFAGAGAVGIEALSRGAREVFFIENHRPTANLIHKNLQSLGISSGAEVLAMNAIRGFEQLAARRLLADFIFLDPPYAKTSDYLEVLNFLDGSRLLAPRGLVIVEHHRKLDLPSRLHNLEESRVVEQGESALTFYRLALAA